MTGHDLNKSKGPNRYSRILSKAMASTLRRRPQAERLPADSHVESASAPFIIRLRRFLASHKDPEPAILMILAFVTVLLILWGVTR